MFDDVLHRVEAALDIPYPQRSEVLRELEADLMAQYEALREEGCSEGQAHEAVVRDAGLSEDALASLQVVHNPLIRRILLRLPGPARDTVEWLCAALPLLVGFYYALTEVPMIQFLNEGGFSMWLVLFVAGAALLLQLRRGVSWFVARDHSAYSLSRNTAGPLYLAAAAFLFSVMGTALNFYVVLTKLSLGHIESADAIAGFTESLTTVIMGGLLAALIVLVQGALQAGLRFMQVKQSA